MGPRTSQLPMRKQSRKNLSRMKLSSRFNANKKFNGWLWPTEASGEIASLIDTLLFVLSFHLPSDMIDFEEAIKKYGPDFHGKHGFPGMMGDLPKKSEGGSKEKPEDPIHKILKYQQEQAKKSAEKPEMMKTGEGHQVVLEAPTSVETSQPKTPGVVRTPSTEAEPSPSDPIREESTFVTSSGPSSTPTVETGDVVPVQEQITPTTVGEERAAEQTAAKFEDTTGETGAAHVKDEL